MTTTSFENNISAFILINILWKHHLVRISGLFLLKILLLITWIVVTHFFFIYDVFHIVLVLQGECSRTIFVVATTTICTMQFTCDYVWKLSDWHDITRVTLFLQSHDVWVTSYTYKRVLWRWFSTFIFIVVWQENRFLLNIVVLLYLIIGRRSNQSFTLLRSLTVEYVWQLTDLGFEGQLWLGVARGSILNIMDVARTLF